jgi:hypothetical protein
MDEQEHGNWINYSTITSYKIVQCLPLGLVRSCRLYIQITLAPESVVECSLFPSPDMIN